MYYVGFVSILCRRQFNKHFLTCLLYFSTFYDTFFHTHTVLSRRMEKSNNILPHFLCFSVQIETFLSMSDIYFFNIVCLCLVIHNKRWLSKINTILIKKSSFHSTLVSLLLLLLLINYDELKKIWRKHLPDVVLIVAKALHSMINCVFVLHWERNGRKKGVNGIKICFSLSLEKGAQEGGN